MSLVEMIAYDVFRNRVYDEGTRSAIVSSTTAGLSNKIDHLSIVVHGFEIEYSEVHGINVVVQPGTGQIDRFELGSTMKSHQEVRDFVKIMSSGRFKRDMYDKITNNCVHFADELCKFLLHGKGIANLFANSPTKKRSSGDFL